MKFSHIESEIHLSCLEVIYMYGQPRMAACCEMSSVSQSVISTTLRFKAESRRPTAASAMCKSRNLCQVRWRTVRMLNGVLTCICKSRLALTICGGDLSGIRC